MYGEMIPVEEVQPLIRMLIARYGSLHEAAHIYDERYGYKGAYGPSNNGGQAYRGSGTRLFNRILSAERASISLWTYDQIETLVWS